MLAKPHLAAFFVAYQPPRISLHALPCPQSCARRFKTRFSCRYMTPREGSTHPTQGNPAGVWGPPLHRCRPSPGARPGAGYAPPVKPAALVGLKPSLCGPQSAFGTFRRDEKYMQQERMVSGSQPPRWQAQEAPLATPVWLAPSLCFAHHRAQGPALGTLGQCKHWLSLVGLKPSLFCLTSRIIAEIYTPSTRSDQRTRHATSTCPG